MKKLINIRCPICGRSAGLVSGAYSFRCKYCKGHPIFSGDTNEKSK